MKKFIHVFENKIVSKYAAEEPASFGGPWINGESIEVPEEMNLKYVAYANGEVYERSPSEEEQFFDEVEESDKYLIDIDKGKRAIALFRLLNDKKHLTTEQKFEIMADADIGQILSMLIIGKLPEASFLISTYEHDGVLVTNDDKFKMIKFLEM